MSNNGTFDVENKSDTSRQSNVLSDRDPLIKKGPIEGGIFKGLIQPCLGEFIAVTLFVFLGTVCVSGGTIFSIAFTHGFALAALITAVGTLSGGHLNPAVTLGVFLCGGIDFLKAICYILSQLIGAILGAALTKGVLSEAGYKLIHGGSHLLPDNTTVGQGVLCEIILTGILVLVVLMTAVDEEWKTPMAALAIGLSVTVGIMAAGNVSGGSMNPARSFGPAVVDSSVQDSQWDYHWIYWVGPVVGSLLASFCYRFVLASPSKRFFNYN